MGTDANEHQAKAILRRAEKARARVDAQAGKLATQTEALQNGIVKTKRCLQEIAAAEAAHGINASLRSQRDALIADLASLHNAERNALVELAQLDALKASFLQTAAQAADLSARRHA